MASGVLAAAEGKTNDPDHEEDRCRNPQEMYGEPSSEENQDEQKCENKHHEKTQPF